MIGIILSVALISCIGIFISTVQNTQLEETKNRLGDYHVTILNAKKNSIDKFKSNPKVDTVGLVEKPEQNEPGIPFIKDKEIKLIKEDAESFKLSRVKVLEGTFPTKDNEIAIEKWVLKFLDKPVKLGDEISIPDENKNTKTYILKGILENRNNAQGSGTVNAYKLIDKPSEKTKIMIKLKDNVDKKAFIKELKDEYGKDNVGANNSLLRFTGESENDNTNNALITATCIIIGIVAIATVFVIYNAFNISIAERMKQFGLLRAIGTTKKQMMNLVLREATVMSIIAIPIGLLCGVIAIYIVAFIFSKMPGSEGLGKLAVIVEPNVIIISTLVGLVSIYISAFLPARAAGKISPLVAINNGTLITKEKNKRSKKWLNKIFKVNRVMAIKNVKRSKKRFYLSTISMAISVTLFVTFTSFMDLTNTFVGPTNEENKVNFELGAISDKGISEDIIKEVKNIDGISKINKSYTTVDSNALIKENQISDLLKKADRTFEDVKFNGENRKNVALSMNFYDKDKMSDSKSYVKEGSIADLKENEVIIARDNIFFNEKGKLFKGAVTDLKVGDEIVIASNSIKVPSMSGEENKEKETKKEQFNDSEVIKLKVKAVMDVSPFEDGMLPYNIKVISRLEDKDKILKANKANKNDIFVNRLSMVLKDKSYESNVDSKLKAIEEANTGLRYTNKIAEDKARQSGELQMKILLMGFTTVIALIGSVNIVNTVSTNIILRRKELAGLKAIGMTDKEVKNMITLEGMLFGVYGGIVGSIIGSILSYLLYKQMSGILGFDYIFPIKYIVIAIIAVIFIGYISALIPLGRLKKDNIIEAIRED